jgi:hypothetical protein
MNAKKNTATIDVLKENLELLTDALKWLKRSYNQCKDINIGKPFSEDDFDKFESLREIFMDTLTYTPLLIKLIENTQKYCYRYF